MMSFAASPAEEPTEVMIAVPASFTWPCRSSHTEVASRGLTRTTDVLVLAGDELTPRERRFVDLVEAVPPLLRLRDRAY